MHQNSDVRNSILRSPSKPCPEFALQEYQRSCKTTAELAGAVSINYRVRRTFGFLHERKRVMYEHLCSGNIAVLGPICFGSTNEGLAAAATAQIFGDDFAGAARASRVDGRRIGVNDRYREAPTGLGVTP
jgi:hypothetical protein